MGGIIGLIALYILFVSIIMGVYYLDKHLKRKFIAARDHIPLDQISDKDIKNEYIIYNLVFTVTVMMIWCFW